MRPTLNTTRVTLRGAPCDALPDCPGVYRFFGESDGLLYVGKSIDVRTRVLSHYTAARRPGRQQRMMAAVEHIDCEPCAGEFGALLRENAAIKSEMPLYNRRQQRRRFLWTLALTRGKAGFLRATPARCLQQGAQGSGSYGLYHGESHAEDTLRTLARDAGLCLQVLGLEHGRGACFASQLKRCRGACTGAEAPEAHNTRLRDALRGQRILAWPFPGRILLQEAAAKNRPGQPRRDWHVVDQWQHLGSYTRRPRAQSSTGSGKAGDCAATFDRDAYGILLRALRSEHVTVLDADSLEVLCNPLRRDADAA